MLEFKQDNAATAIILTLTEKVSLQQPNYLFVFTHVLTRQVVAFVKTESDDESDYTQRYNQFTIDPSSVFAGRPVGEWHYKVYEQLSDSNLDPANAGGLLEEGKTLLDRAEEFAYTMYESPTSYIAYNG